MFSPKVKRAFPEIGELLELESYIVTETPRVVRELLGENPSPEWQEALNTDYLALAWNEAPNPHAVMAYSLMMHAVATGLIE